jgi:hypothetical protein
MNCCSELVLIDMDRWAKVIVLFSCMATPMLAQTTESSDESGPVNTEARSAGPGAAGRTPSVPSAINYPLDSFRDFAAVMIGSRAEPGEGTSQGHIYRSGDRMRMEEPGGGAYFITDLNTGETYGIAEVGCIHDDHPYIRAIPFHIAGKTDATVTRVSAGNETVEGHSCQVEEITVSSPMLANPQKMRLWEAQDLQGFPIKIEFVLSGGRGPVIRYKNVVFGPPDPTLFLHPKSCQPLPRGPAAPPEHEQPPAQ